ncbi:MAG: hypothetical protein HC799_13685 [Limnothrix sp. RL_2_0]|nr:hypothetical protein [Limnothrix sp. RL_2_0]
MIEVTGTIDKQDVGVGTWVIKATDGTVYELRQLPNDLKQKGLKAVVTGTVLEDAMSIAMVGPILSVTKAATL